MHHHTTSSFVTQDTFSLAFFKVLMTRKGQEGPLVKLQLK